MITFFDQDDNSSNDRLKPFVEDYIEANPNDIGTYDVISVTRTRKRTGYLLDTEKFTIMLFENSKVLKLLLEALTVWHESGHGYTIIARTQHMYPFYQLGTDLDRPTNWYMSKGKFFTAKENTTSTSELLDTRNPFLPKPSTRRHKNKSTPTTPTENPSSDA